MCQNYKLPPEWVAINEFLTPEVYKVPERQVTGLLSSFMRVYGIFWFEVDKTRIAPSSHPKEIKLSSDIYSVDKTEHPGLN